MDMVMCNQCDHPTKCKGCPWSGWVILDDVVYEEDKKGI